jgi:hypothetical protein
MKPIFTIHAGEYVVGDQIEKKFGKNVNVWIPSKDTGIDLLLTDKSNLKTASLQVKFSKDFLFTSMKPEFREELLACGWWTLNRKKLEESNADFWVFALHSFKDKEFQYVIIQTQKLRKIYDGLERNGNIIQSYIWVTNSRPKMCWEARDISKEKQISLAGGTFNNDMRNLTSYLEDWDSIMEKLGIK